MSVLVVDFAGFGVGEGFVCFGYFDEFLLGGFVATAGLLVAGGVVFMGQRRTGSCLGGISWRAGGRLF